MFYPSETSSKITAAYEVIQKRGYIKTSFRELKIEVILYVKMLMFDTSKLFRK